MSGGDRRDGLDENTHIGGRLLNGRDQITPKLFIGIVLHTADILDTKDQKNLTAAAGLDRVRNVVPAAAVRERHAAVYSRGERKTRARQEKSVAQTAIAVLGVVGQRPADVAADKERIVEPSRLDQIDRDRGVDELRRHNRSRDIRRGSVVA